MNKRLIQARSEKGLTQEQIASLAGIDRSTYAHYERGRSPHLETAITIASIVKKPVEYLFLRKKVLKQRNQPTGTE